jgi:hypothetical protein
MKRHLIALALCCSTAGMPQAQAAEWFGEIDFISGTEDCGHIPGARLDAFFRPQRVGGNGQGSRLSVFGRTFAFAENFELPSGNFNENFKTVNAFILDAFARPVDDHVVRVRFTSVRPSRIRADTPTLQISGQIKGYGFESAKCVMDFRMVLVNQDF